MVREFSIVRELSRREVERHSKRFIGVVVAEPRFRSVNGLSEWVCDIRVGAREEWAVIKDCLIAQWAVGAITDINIPVLCERNEAGRVTIIARSEIHLPDIVLDEYTYEELGFAFMRNLKLDNDGNVVDGFGHVFAFATTDGEPGTYVPPEAVKGQRYSYNNDIVEWGSSDFHYGETPFLDRIADWFIDQIDVE